MAVSEPWDMGPDLAPYFFLLLTRLDSEIIFLFSLFSSYWCILFLRYQVVFLKEGQWLAEIICVSRVADVNWNPVCCSRELRLRLVLTGLVPVRELMCVCSGEIRVFGKGIQNLCHGSDLEVLSLEGTMQQV